jgi:hypothetical protein
MLQKNDSILYSPKHQPSQPPLKFSRIFPKKVRQPHLAPEPRCGRWVAPKAHQRLGTKGLGGWHRLCRMWGTGG